MLDLHKLILDLRHDLRTTHGFALQENRDKFLGWLITSGLREYRAVAEDQQFVARMQHKGFGADGSLSLLQHVVYTARPDVQAAFSLPLDFKRFLVWFYTNGFEEYGYWQFLTEIERKVVLAMPEPWHSRLRAVIARQTPASPEPVVAHLRYGVTCVGYAFGQLGIGEDVRMAARALLAAGVPTTMLNFLPGHDIPQNDRSMQAHVAPEGNYRFNIFCITAEETARFYAERGRAQFRNRYNIGYWPWELGQWPENWKMLLHLVDEVWVSTQHTYDALAPVCDKPLLVMPMAVELGEVGLTQPPELLDSGTSPNDGALASGTEQAIMPATRSQVRRHFGLPAAARLFCFSFDLNSSMDRKNPQACVAAFLQAFPRQRLGVHEVGLVIKVNRPAQQHKAWDTLKAQAAHDARIHIIEGTLQRPDLLALYKACDCFLSLHRAEGFGRGLAEALQLGLHVICTGYSGNVDFCQPPHADLVRYTLVKVRKHQYVHAAGQVWAEPDVQHAAELMYQFVQAPARRAKPRAWPEFSPAVVGERYRQRLEEIRKG